jgi:hypothetical protein
MAVTINASTTAGAVTTADTSGILQLQTNGTAALTVDASQNVGIGTASPTRNLQVNENSATVYTGDFDDVPNQLYLNNTNTTVGAYTGIQMDVGGNSQAAISSVRTADGAVAITFGTRVSGSRAERARIAATGGIQSVNSISVGNATPSTSGAGITFPATQSASSNANTLDDYEEGTFTPSYSLGSGSGTFTTGVAKYTKIGNVVTLSMRFVGSSVSGAANLAVAGLPFPFANSNADSSGAFREYTTQGNLYVLSFGSSTDVSMQRYDNSNGLPNGAPAWSGTFTYITN